MKAIHLLGLLKVGGGQSVALNYAKILKKYNIDSIFYGTKYGNGKYEEFAGQYVDIVHDIDKDFIKSMDYIFIHTNKNLLKVLLFRLYPLGWSKKKVVYFQHLNYPTWKFFILSFIINFVCTDFVQITPITAKNIERFIRIRSRFIVNFKLLSYRRKEWPCIRRKVRTELGYTDEDIVYVYSTRFMEGKNVDKFVALAKQSVCNKHMKFLLIGDGPENEDAKLYKADNYKWLGFQSDVEKYLIASDVYLFVSLYKLEMLPMALVEAINYELSIASFDTDINRFLLDNKVFKDITVDLIKDWKSLPSGKNLKKYNEDYATEKIKELL